MVRKGVNNYLDDFVLDIGETYPKLNVGLNLPILAPLVTPHLTLFQLGRDNFYDSDSIYIT
jgi:hypothetical protein